MRLPALAALTATLAAGLFACAGPRGDRTAATRPTPAAAPATVVLVARHAEKTAGGAPLNLEPRRGLPRAEALAEIAARRGVSAVYSTPFCRTVQTAQPSARRLGLTLGLLVAKGLGDDLGRCRPQVDVPTFELAGAFAAPDLAAALRSRHPGEVVLVVGHSNTVPGLVEALGAPSPCAEVVRSAAADGCELPEDRYGDLFVVRTGTDGGAELAAESYGEPAPGAPPG